MTKAGRHALQKRGLGHWVRRVLAECRKAAKGFSPDVVHDLRVALRRCRSMADGVVEVDTSPAWREMKASGKRLFRRLGELRDTQVMMGWVRELGGPDDAVGEALLKTLTARERELKEGAQRALDRFDCKQWRAWTRLLPQRLRRMPADGQVARLVALERWTEAQALHQAAMRNRSGAAFHRLRIGLKRFRYTVENFLPSRHAEWSNDLKTLQDLLGEVHDLDLLWPALVRTGEVCDAAARAGWRAAIDRERKSRLDGYRRMMTGKSSLWAVWRAGLPQGRRLESAAQAKFATWAAFLDPDFAQARHVTALASQLFAGLRRARVPGVPVEPRARDILRAAAVMHDVGRAGGKKGHHKSSYNMIRALAPPPGWTAEEMEMAALVARYHRGKSPRDQHLGFAVLTLPQRQAVTFLAGVLRLAEALDAGHTGRVKRLEVTATAELVVIHAEGFVEDEGTTAFVATRRLLLESACKRPVVIRARQEAPQETGTAASEM